MRITLYILVFICRVYLFTTSRFIFQIKRVGANHHPVIHVIHPAEIDWTCGEVPWDFKDDDNSNKTSVRVPPKNPIRPSPPNKLVLIR
jgi:hypothetical protein